MATGTSVIVFGQGFGGAIMLAAGETIFQSRLLENLASYLGLHNTNTHELLGNGPALLQVLVPTEKLPLLIQAVISASFTQTFYLALALAALSILAACSWAGSRSSHRRSLHRVMLRCLCRDWKQHSTGLRPECKGD
jgi:hypothetical protein